MTLTPVYFDRVYALEDDPWGFDRRWYEQRKRAVTLAALPRPRYGRVFEPGCSIGTLSESLASRCDSLLSCDVNAKALNRARRRLAGYRHAVVEKRILLDEWPPLPFDLIVVSELGYYFDQGDLRRLVDKAMASLAPGGALLACHWRHAVDDYPLSGDQVHACLNRLIVLPRLLRHQEADFILELWSRDARSVAQAENIA